MLLLIGGWMDKKQVRMDNLFWGHAQFTQSGWYTADGLYKCCMVGGAPGRGREKRN
jgi:hypothetical protein